ncbi:MAG TPA: hypothetical protein DCM26_04115 [Desulfotomaculum sp.]|nr:hypothetical protein [Desulfotomaculum sp.]
MTKTHSIGNRLLVAIDVAKRYNDVLICWPCRKKTLLQGCQHPLGSLDPHTIGQIAKLWL